MFLVARGTVHHAFKPAALRAEIIYRAGAPVSTAFDAFPGVLGGAAGAWFAGRFRVRQDGTPVEPTSILKTV